MADIHAIEDEYLGHKILIQAGRNSKNFDITAHAWIDDPEGRTLARFRTIGDSWKQSEKERLAEEALHRAHGAILLGFVDELNDTEYAADYERVTARRSDEYIRRVVLRCFKNAYRSDPWQGGRVAFDDIGVALVEDVEVSQVEYCLARLKDEGLIEDGGVVQQPGARTFKATALGLRESDAYDSIDGNPWSLVEEIVSRVDRFISGEKPEIVESLRRQVIRVSGKASLSDHEVGEVAHACEQVIWDFLDVDRLWLKVEGARPQRDRVRDRVRILLATHVESETDRDLVLGLTDYVLAWFGPLGQFVNKHRHLPKTSNRTDASRCVTYTYLLLGDLIDLLELK